MRTTRKMQAASASQRGVMLLEALIAILLFSAGVLALVGLQAMAVKNTAEAKHRADAAFFANQIIAQMWASDPDPLALNAYDHFVGGGACAANGSASADSNVADWVSAINTALPNSRQQINFNTANGRVTVTICWRSAQEIAAGATLYHRYTTVAQIR